MIDIIVQRGAGDRPGADIVDPLISAIPVAIQRGRNELDERSSAMTEMEEETIYRLGVRVGDLADFHDLKTGEIWKGKIAGVTHNVRKVNNALEITTTLHVKRPTNFFAG